MIKTNQGNVKIATLLISLVGIGAYFLNQTEEVQNSKANVLSQVTGIQKSIEDTKIKYIDEPISIAIDSKKQLDEITNNKTDLMTSKVLGEQIHLTNPTSEVTSPKLPNITNDKTNLDKLTNQMVENCKIITEEYNKIQKK